jgi:hypothetical protein
MTANQWLPEIYRRIENKGPRETLRDRGGIQVCRRLRAGTGVRLSRGVQAVKSGGEGMARRVGGFGAAELFFTEGGMFL